MSKSYRNVKGFIFLYTKDYTLEVHDENIWKELFQVFTDEDTVAWIKTDLEIVGALNIKTTHTKCRYDEHPKCITEFYWA